MHRIPVNTSDTAACTFFERVRLLAPVLQRGSSQCAVEDCVGSRLAFHSPPRRPAVSVGGSLATVWSTYASWSGPMPDCGRSIRACPYVVRTTITTIAPRLPQGYVDSSERS